MSRNAQDRRAPRNWKQQPQTAASLFPTPATTLTPYSLKWFMQLCYRSHFVIVKVSSVTSFEKKLTFSPKLLTRTAPIPTVTFSALALCDASVKMNHVDVLLALRLLGIFSRSSSRNLVSAEKRGSDNRQSPASYACCVTADRHRLANLPKICPAANCIRPLNLRASFLDIRPELINPAIVSDNSVVRFSVLSIRVKP